MPCTAASSGTTSRPVSRKLAAQPPRPSATVGAPHGTCARTLAARVSQRFRGVTASAWWRKRASQRRRYSWKSNSRQRAGSSSSSAARRGRLRVADAPAQHGAAERRALRSPAASTHARGRRRKRALGRSRRNNKAQAPAGTQRGAWPQTSVRGVPASHTAAQRHSSRRRRGDWQRSAARAQLPPRAPRLRCRRRKRRRRKRRHVGRTLRAQRRACVPCAWTTAVAQCSSDRGARVVFGVAVQYGTLCSWFNHKPSTDH
jgi:hypothetical protein